MTVEAWALMGAGGRFALEHILRQVLSDDITIKTHALDALEAILRRAGGSCGNRQRAVGMLTS